MAVNWAKLVYPECESQIMVLAVLITFHVIGLLSVWYLIYSRINHKDKNLTTGNSFLKIKLISMYIFGLGYMFHCGYFIWKHTFSNDCRDEDLSPRIEGLGIAYNVISILYTFFLFLYFGMFYVRRRDNSVEENAASLGILLANSFIWLDTLFSESNVLFKSHSDENNSTRPFNLTESSNRALEAIEKTDPFLSPAMIEFSLMAIDMLFTKTDDSSSSSNTNTVSNDVSSGSQSSKKISNDDVSGSQRSKSPSDDDIKSNLKKSCLGYLCQLIFSLGSFILFALAFTVVLTTDSSKDFLTTPNDFYAYVSVQLSVKSVMLILILMCLCIMWQRLTFKFNVWAFVLIIACFGNIVYHMFYCFALHYESNRNQTNQVQNIKSEFVGVAWADNIISIIVGSFQTLFILGFHSPKEDDDINSNGSNQRYHKSSKEKCVHYYCSLLGVINLGLWVSDSIGEGRFPVFSMIIYRVYEEEVWSFINKIILPLTIFFRFHSALDFFEFYWTPKKEKKSTA